MADIQATGADIVKIATTALDITDVARIFKITVHSQVRCVRFLSLGTSRLGIRLWIVATIYRVLQRNISYLSS